MVKWKRDVIFSAFIFVFSVAMFVYTGAAIGTTTIDYFVAMPDVYIQMWLVILGALSILVFINAVRKKDMTELPKIWGKLQVFTVAALIVYLFIMPHIGFYLSSFVFLSTVIIVYSYSAGKLEDKEKRNKIIQILFYIVFSAIVVFLVQHLFSELLGVRLPKIDLF